MKLKDFQLGSTNLCEIASPAYLPTPPPTPTHTRTSFFQFHVIFLSSVDMSLLWIKVGSIHGTNLTMESHQSSTIYLVCDIIILTSVITK